MCILIIIIDESVTNSMEVECFSDCDSNGVAINPTNDNTIGDLNVCCVSDFRSSGFGENGADCTATCKFCYNHCISLHILAIYLCDKV